MGGDEEKTLRDLHGDDHNDASENHPVEKIINRREWKKIVEILYKSLVYVMRPTR